MIDSGKARLTFAAVLVIVFGCVFFFTSGEANLSHQTGASGILTMAQCLACHSATSTRPVSICLGDHCLYTNEHSLMHRYPPLGKESKYAPVAEIIEAGCVLEDGKVTCLSCHNLTNPPPHLIREGDELCFICHRYLRSDP